MKTFQRSRTLVSEVLRLIHPATTGHYETVLNHYLITRSEETVELNLSKVIGMV